jgi:glycosyltransferase involved in cell wall biosynthesis
MKIGIDMRMYGGGSGIARYIKELSLAILEQDKTNEYVLFLYKIDDSIKNQFSRFKVKLVETNAKHYSIREQTTFVRQLYKEKLDLVHFPHFNVPFFYRKPFVVTIHDLIHQRYPGRNKSRIFHRAAFRMIFSHAVKASKAIIAVSNFTKKEILEFYPEVSKKVFVVYEAATGNLKIYEYTQAQNYVNKKFNVNSKYFLYVGVYRRYKNLSVLAKAFDLFCAKNFGFKLVLAGEPDPFYPEIQQEIRKINNRDRLIEVGKVNDEDLSHLYSAATAFILPSKTEGFGLILLEAAKYKLPIIASDIDVIKEVMGDSVIYFNLNSPNDLAEKMYSIADNPKINKLYAQKSDDRRKTYSWTKAGEETLNIYRQILNKL